MPDYTPGKFVWWELNTRNPAEAANFYTELIGWKKVEMPMPGDQGTYTMFGMEDPMTAAVAGMAALGEDRPDTPNHWQGFVSVQDVDATAEAIQANGGQVLAGPFDIPGMLRMAVCTDPHGAVISIMKGFGGDAPDVPSTHGSWHWAELYSPNVAESVAFYTKVFPWTASEMDMGPGQGTYHLMNTGEKSRAGIMQRPKDEIPPMWANYLEVTDVDAIFAKATEGGSTPIMPPMTMPGIGRFAQVMDPNGAFVAFITPDRTQQG